MSIGGINDLTGAISSSIDSVTQGLSKAVSAGGAPAIADAIQVFGSSAKSAFDQAATAAGAKPNVGAPGFLEQPLEFLGKLAGKAQDLVRALSNPDLHVNEKLGSALTKTLDDKATQIKAQEAKIQKGMADGSDVTSEMEKLKAMKKEFSMLSSAFSEVLKNIGQATQSMARKG